LGADETGGELDFNDNTFVTNPYWAAYQFYQNDKRNRLIGSALARYDFTDWLYLQARIGIDRISSRNTQWEPYGTNYIPLGSIN
jgi:hypothetical protein